MTKTIKKSINVYPDLTFEDCVNELRCSRFRKWLIIKLMPRQFRFEKVDTFMECRKGEMIANLTIFPKSPIRAFDFEGNRMPLEAAFDIGEDHHD